MQTGRRRLLLGAAAWGLAGLLAPLAGCGRKLPRAQPLAAGATVLALGDSLTFGTGAAPHQAYPAVLEGLSGWRVVNAGVPGDTSAQALERLPELLQQHAPALVLVSLGPRRAPHAPPRHPRAPRWTTPRRRTRRSRAACG